jgi:hydroxymethylbilane synthase
LRLQKRRRQGRGQQPGRKHFGRFVQRLCGFELRFLPLIAQKLRGESGLKKKNLIMGTRGSMLALRQSELIKAGLLARFPDLDVQLRVIKTTGDKITDVPLARVGGKGLFVKEIEEALLAGEIDLAVHSMKDVPSELPEGCTIGAVPRREDPRDVLVSVVAESLEALPSGAVVGTSSLRRGAQVLRLRPDVTVESLRGNLDTRLRKAREGRYDAVILAAAGIRRMGWEESITAYLNPEVFLPAIGQGAIGIEIREGDGAVGEWVNSLHDPDTADAVEAERGFLKELEGGCQVPIGGHAKVSVDEVALTGLVASLDGRTVHEASGSAPRDEAETLGRRLAQQVLAAGAKEILDAVYCPQP